MKNQQVYGRLDIVCARYPMTLNDLEQKYHTGFASRYQRIIKVDMSKGTLRSYQVFPTRSAFFFQFKRAHDANVQVLDGPIILSTNA